MVPFRVIFSIKENCCYVEYKYILISIVLFARIIMSNVVIDWLPLVIVMHE